MLKKRDLLGLISKLYFNPKVIIDLNENIISNRNKESYISVNNTFIISFIFLISFVSVLILFQNEPYFRMVFSDIFLPVIEILVVLSLFYAAKISYRQGKRMQIAWLILGMAVLSYAIGDILWSILELVIHQQPFHSVADIFYLLFYPLFVMGIYYLPKISLSRDEELKLIIDITIVIITGCLILLTFLIMPTIDSNYDLLGSVISITYIIGDVVILFALIRILFNNFKNTYSEPLLLLGLGIIFQIITDSIYSYQSIQGTYISGGFLDAGWVLSFIFIGLAAILQINSVIHGSRKKTRSKSRIQNFNFPTHLPLLGIAVAYTLFIWSNYNLNFPNSAYVEIGVGVIIFMILFRQAVALYENRNLYSSAKKEINSRKAAEKALKENQRTLETLISNLPGVAYRCKNDSKWTMEFVSEGCLGLTGYQAEDLIMNKCVSYEDLIHPEDRQMVWDTIQKDLKENKQFKINYRIITADLKEKHVWEQGKSILSPEGDLIALEGFITDITKRKKAEEALKTSELYYRTIFENTGTATLIFKENTVVSLANTEFEKLSGYSKEEMEGKKSWIDLIVEDDSKRVMNYHNLMKIDPYSVPKNYETKLVNKQGDILDVYVTTALIPYTKNRLISLLDITDEKKSRKAFRESEAKLKIAMDMAKLVHWEYDIKSDMFTFDDQFYALYGTTTEQYGSQMFSEEYTKRFIPPEESFIVAKEINKSLKTIDPNYSGQFDHTIIRSDGEKRFITVRYGIIKDSKGNTIKIYGANQDITERKETEKSLKESKNRYRELLENSFDAVVIHSGGKIISANSAAMELLGAKSHEDFVDKPLLDFVHPDYIETVMERIEEMLGNKAVPPVEEKFISLDGEVIDVEVLATGFHYKNKHAVQVVFRDIGERKKAEKEIKTSLKDKEVLLKEIHHRVKNNLQIISSLLDLQANYVDDDEAINVLQESQNRVKSMALIHEMLYQSTDLASINLSEYIQNLVQDLFYSYGAKNNIKPIINMEQIFLNIETAIPCGLIISELISNSLKYAFPNNKTLGEIFIGIHLHDKEFELIISDNGIGLPQDIDFKDMQSSLGLRLVNMLVKQIEGSIELERAHGTKFKIKFEELNYKKRF